MAPRAAETPLAARPPKTSETPGDFAETARDAGPPQRDGAAAVSFVREVWPVLVCECIRCHDPEFRGDFCQLEGAYD